MIVGGLVLFGTAAATVGSLALAWRFRDHWESPGGAWLAVVLASQGLFCGATTAGLLVFDPTARLALETLAWVGISGLAVPFLTFALAYSGHRGVTRSGPYRLLWLFPLTFVVLVVTTPVTNLLWMDFRVVPQFGLATASYELTAIGTALFAFGLAIIGTGAVVLVDTAIRYELYRAETLAIAISIVPPVVPAMGWLFDLGPFPGLSLLAVGFIPHVVADGYAVLATDLFEFTPGTSRAADRSTLDRLDSPVVVVNGDGRIVRVNAAALSLFDARESTVLKRPISELVGTSVEFDRDDQTVSIRVGSERRTYAVSSSRETDATDRGVGYSLVFQDVTTQIRREQRLSVLNRVLRHNLRNDLNVVLGNLQLARANDRSDASDANTTAARETRRSDEQTGTGADLAAAERRAAGLLQLSEDARLIDRLLEHDDVDGRRVALAELTRAAVDEADTDLDPDVVADSSGVTVEVPTATFRLVITRLLSAVETRLGGPTTVAVEAVDDEAAVEVRCCGALPANEIALLSGGGETALNHTDGLDLWMVKWGVDALDGSLSFAAEDDPSAPTARITLPTGGD